jgi:hypothetical protein
VSHNIFEYHVHGNKESLVEVMSCSTPVFICNCELQCCLCINVKIKARFPLLILPHLFFYLLSSKNMKILGRLSNVILNENRIDFVLISK